MARGRGELMGHHVPEQREKILRLGFYFIAAPKGSKTKADVMWSILNAGGW